MDSNLVAKWQALKVEIWNLIEKDPKFLGEIEKLVAERKSEEERREAEKRSEYYRGAQRLVDHLRSSSFKD
ncbi:MAG TPA: hypothetical protein PLZ99_00915 [Parcubacteria group bacterium]|nr:hypothetical protein [Parcubacteria group bacterium]